jgi:hypothetical protein
MMIAASQLPFIRVLTGKPYKKDADIHADILGKVRTFSLHTQKKIHIVKCTGSVVASRNLENEKSCGDEREGGRGKSNECGAK